MLADLLVDALAAGGERRVRELLAHVRSCGGHGISRAAIERVLRDDGRFEVAGDPAKGRWRLSEVQAPQGGGASPGPDAAVATDRATATRAALGALALRAWQAEALATWSRTGRGVVEAVTGTGKTRLAIAAVQLLADRGARTLVLVPSLELQDQWVREVGHVLPRLRVGRLGGGHDDDLFGCEVLVATPHSAASVPVDLPPTTPGLVVADEAHRYGATTWAEALPRTFGFRLALTATYERGDEGITDVLTPYFGEVVLRYGYDRAVAEGSVAPFSIALVGVELGDDERASYDATDGRIRSLRRELVGPLGMPAEPRALLRAVTAVVAEADASGRPGPQVRACREYLVRLRERREIAATARAKLALCDLVGPALTGRRALVFTDTVEQAEQAALRLTAAGARAETVHGQLGGDRRRIRLASFRSGRLRALVAPRVLDEGVDVPDADLALVLAAFRTRRQMVQRLGRVLRRKVDGGHARLVLAYARDTGEDPAAGGHADFLGEVRDVATEVVTLDARADAAGLLAWIRG